MRPGLRNLFLFVLIGAGVRALPAQADETAALPALSGSTSEHHLFALFDMRDERRRLLRTGADKPRLLLRGRCDRVQGGDSRTHALSEHFSGDEFNASGFNDSDFRKEDFRDLFKRQSIGENCFELINRAADRNSRVLSDDASGRERTNHHKIESAAFRDLARPVYFMPGDWVPSALDQLSNGGFTTPPDNGAPVPYTLNGHVDYQRKLPWQDGE